MGVKLPYKPVGQLVSLSKFSKSTGRFTAMLLSEHLLYPVLNKLTIHFRQGIKIKAKCLCQEYIKCSFRQVPYFQGSLALGPVQHESLFPELAAQNLQPLILYKYESLFPDCQNQNTARTNSTLVMVVIQIANVIDICYSIYENLKCNCYLYNIIIYLYTYIMLK